MTAICRIFVMGFGLVSLGLSGCSAEAGAVGSSEAAAGALAADDLQLVLSAVQAHPIAETLRMMGGDVAVLTRLGQPAAANVDQRLVGLAPLRAALLDLWRDPTDRRGRDARLLAILTSPTVGRASVPEINLRNRVYPPVANAVTTQARAVFVNRYAVAGSVDAAVMTQLLEHWRAPMTALMQAIQRDGGVSGSAVLTPALPVLREARDFLISRRAGTVDRYWDLVIASLDSVLVSAGGRPVVEPAALQQVRNPGSTALSVPARSAVLGIMAGLGVAELLETAGFDGPHPWLALLRLDGAFRGRSLVVPFVEFLWSLETRPWSAQFPGT